MISICIYINMNTYKHNSFVVSTANTSVALDIVVVSL